MEKVSGTEMFLKMKYGTGTGNFRGQIMVRNTLRVRVFFEKPSTGAEKPTVHVGVLYQSKNPMLRNLLNIAFRRERILGENNSGNRVFTNHEIHSCRN